jgi:hypothetical protein
MHTGWLTKRICNGLYLHVSTAFEKFINANQVRDSITIITPALQMNVLSQKGRMKPCDLLPTTVRIETGRQICF